MELHDQTAAAHELVAVIVLDGLRSHAAYEYLFPERLFRHGSGRAAIARARMGSTHIRCDAGGLPARARPNDYRFRGACAAARHERRNPPSPPRARVAREWDIALVQHPGKLHSRNVSPRSPGGLDRHGYWRGGIRRH